VARKDLSRTVIEGGRYYRNCWERRASHGAERATTRAWLDAVEVDLDEAEESVPPPIKHVGKSFRDKLAPAMRWLASQVGRPWSKVYSELRDRFDTRTVAGRHVVEDHMLKWVRRHSDEGLLRHYYRFELFVDAHGILRKPKNLGRSYQNVRGEVASWSAGRVCASTYRGWWWFRRDLLGDACYDYKCKKHHFKNEGYMRFHQARFTPVGAMTAGELRYLDRLTDDMRRGLVIASPWPAR